jgi:hypothetical protein
VIATPNPRQPKPRSQQARISPTRQSLPPWKKVWRGPLPPKRVSPVKTLGDVLLPALALASGRTVAGGTSSPRPAGDPQITSIQNSNSALAKRTTRLAGSGLGPLSDLQRPGSGPSDPRLGRPSRGNSIHRICYQGPSCRTRGLEGEPRITPMYLQLFFHWPISFFFFGFLR